MITNSETSPANKYSTRKKIIDFAKLGERLSLSGSNCHFCKSVMTVQNSNACRNSEKVNNKKKSCNKKFCYDCLQKNFMSFWTNRSNKDWSCPCCSSECTCVQCKKNLIKEKNLNNEREISMNKAKKHTEDIQNDLMNGEHNQMEIDRECSYNLQERADCENVNFNCENNYENNSIDISFDFDSLFKTLQFSKVHIDKYSTFQRVKKYNELNDEDFMNYNAARDDYLQTIDKYKKQLNLNKLFN